MRIDDHAKEIVVQRFALPACLHIPIAARSFDDLETYVGKIERVIAPSSPPNAVLLNVEFTSPEDGNLPIWELPESRALRQSQQLWVNVHYKPYRRAYARAFPERRIEGLVIDHVLSREVAKLKGFGYVRLEPISRGANSSSGGLSEKWAVEYYRSPAMIAKSQLDMCHIQYADLADIVKMLDRKTGGALQEPVNDAQSLVRPRQANVNA